MNLILEYPPSTNRLWRNFRGRMVLSAEARAYKAQAAYTARERGATLLTGGVCVEIHVFAPRVNGDLDNRGKIVLDSLQGVVYENDSQVQELHLYRHLDRKQPRIELTITEVLQP